MLDRMTRWVQVCDGAFRAAWAAVQPLHALSGLLPPGQPVEALIRGPLVLDPATLDAACNEVGKALAAHRQIIASGLGPTAAIRLLTDAMVATARSHQMTEDELGPAARQILAAGRRIAEQDHAILQREQADAAVRAQRGAEATAAVLATMPALRGSDKQIAWATRIREEMVAGIVGSHALEALDDEERLAIEVIRLIKEARAVIDNLRIRDTLGRTLAEQVLSNLDATPGFDRLRQRAEAATATPIHRQT